MIHCKNNVQLQSEQALPLIILYVTVGIAICLVNLIMITAIATKHSLRDSTSIILTNLAISDFLVGLVCVPLITAEIYYEDSVSCLLDKTQGLFSAFLNSVSVFWFCIVNVDRYLHLSKLDRYEMFMTKAKLRIIIGSGWLLALLFGISYLFLSRLIYGALTGTLMLLTTFGIVWCYWKIGKLKKASAKRVQGYNDTTVNVLKADVTETSERKLKTLATIQTNRITKCFNGIQNEQRSLGLTSAGTALRNVTDLDKSNVEVLHDPNRISDDLKHNVLLRIKRNDTSSSESSCFKNFGFLHDQDEEDRSSILNVPNREVVSSVYSEVGKNHRIIEEEPQLCEAMVMDISETQSCHTGIDKKNVNTMSDGNRVIDNSEIMSKNVLSRIKHSKAQHGKLVGSHNALDSPRTNSTFHNVHGRQEQGFRHVEGKTTKVKKQKKRSTNGNVPGSYKIVRTVIILVVIYFVCRAPYLIVVMIQGMKVFKGKSNVTERNERLWTLLVGYVNSLINPLIYGFRQRSINRAIIELLTKYRCHR